MRNDSYACAGIGILLMGLALPACSGDDDGGSGLTFGSGGITATGGSATGGTATGGSATGGTATGGTADSGGDGGGTDTAGDDGGTSGGDSAGDDGGTRFDVGGSGDIPGGAGCQDPDGECGCNAVDILFVVDNSGSMGSHQTALANAFPQLADAMFDSLPLGTNLHVGVTTTEFRKESSGSSSNSNGSCSVNGGGQLPGIYVTPDQQDYGTQGTQGKLRDVGGMTYYDIDTDAPMADRQAFTTWFGQAIVAGENGSNVEMSSGAAAWAGEPANLPHNAGFLRDAGAVYVIIVIQDEFDQTPADGGALLDMVAQQKAQCGGINCVVGGGWLNDSCNDVEGFDNLPKMVAGFSDSFVRDIGQGISGADLASVLAPIIASKCEEIPPVG